ncbi:hypothetical protein O9929_10260 [Vibrio lentus]|nr:hypothetical protein [Vibrio lentus]
MMARKTLCRCSYCSRQSKKAQQTESASESPIENQVTLKKDAVAAAIARASQESSTNKSQLEAPLKILAMLRKTLLLQLYARAS